MAINSGRDARFRVSFVTVCVISLALSGGVLAGNSPGSFEADPNVTVIDDFESYTNDSLNLLWETWIDGVNRLDRPGNHSGATTGTLFPGMIAHSGGQSMPLYYNNLNLPYYSEVARAFATPQDWLGGDANSLYLCSLWFRGRASNASDSIYLSLEDSTGHEGTTTDPNSQTISLGEWQQWAIRLTAFTAAGVDLHKVRSIGIGIGSRANPHSTGSGVIYVDDIEVRRAEPMPLPPDLVEVADAPYVSLAGLAAGSAVAQASQVQTVQQLGLPLEVKTANTGIVLRLIPAGRFTMGSPTTEAGRYSEEVQHQVALTQAFYCGKFEVTQGQWQAVMGSNPSYFQNAGLEAPIEQVCWDDCQTFLKKLCEMEGVAEGIYRLLTEAEWEYACRAGTTSAYSFGDNPSTLGEYAWYRDNSGNTTHPVGQKMPNAYGLHDMIGNVWEWCQDRYASYPSGPQVDPLGPADGSNRIYRGSGWGNYARGCRSANRLWDLPSRPSASIGFRLARTIP